MAVILIQFIYKSLEALLKPKSEIASDSIVITG